MQARKRNRLEQYDYSSPNAYFITICTVKKRNFLWTDVGAVIDRPENVPLSKLGLIVQKSITEIPARYPAVTVDRFVIMPNHVHLLLQIHSDADGRSMRNQCMIATGNHCDYKIRCALQHAPTCTIERGCRGGQ